MGLFVITGASSGIGEAAARRLAREPGAQLILVARRGDRLEALGPQLTTPSMIAAVDLTADDAPAQIAGLVRDCGGRLNGLVNNAGARFPGTFADSGWANVRRTMAINFDAQVRLTEALLPSVRAAAIAGETAAIVNVASTSGVIARPGAAAYSASKAALAAWSDALGHEEAAHGVHVALIQPGFVATEGFPQAELTARRVTRWAVGDVEGVAEAIAAAALGGASESYSPRGYRLAVLARHLAPGLVRRALRSGSASVMSPTTRST